MEGGENMNNSGKLTTKPEYSLSQVDGFNDMTQAVEQLGRLVGSSLSQMRVLESNLFGLGSLVSGNESEGSQSISDKILMTVKMADELYKMLIRANEQVRAD